MSKRNLPIIIQQEFIDFLCGKIDEIPEINIVETVSECAENHRIIGKGLTANPGKFSWTITPYNREIADCMSDSSPVLECYVIKPTQVGFTVCVTENDILYDIKHGIGPVTYVGGTQEMAQQQVAIRIDEMISQSGMQHKIKPNITKRKGKSTGDTSDVKQYGGSFARFIGPNSESRAASLPAKKLHLDEMDKYPVQLAANGMVMGDIVEKLIRRQDSYGSLRKTLGGSTPKQKSISRIEPLVESGDMRYYNITCKKCGMQHPILWHYFKWEKTEDGKIDLQFEHVDGKDIITKDPCYLECPGCGYKLREKDKFDVMQEKGRGGTAEWIPTKKPDRPFVQSYIINGLMGQRTWVDIALQFIEVKDDPLKFPDFINDVLGETWKENEFKPDINELMQLAQEFEHWPIGFIKKEVIFLTLAADIQKDRIEAGLIGWGRNKQGYMIDYWTFEGDPASVENKSWKALSEKIYAKYKREDGQEMFVQYAFIDSQYLSDTVDLFCDGFPYSENTMAGVYPIQSRETQDKIVKQFKSNIKTPVVGLHDQALKRALYNVLRKKPQGPGSFPGYYLHFSEEYGPEFYKQLTSEEIVSVKIKGVVKGIKILNTKQKRNEVLDIVKMNMAALQYSMDRYFFVLNNSLKSQKRNEVQEDTSLFFDSMEELLFD